MLLRARVVYPVSGPPIEDGAVTIQNGRILEVARFRDLSCTGHEVDDLGDVILLPGLINAHCHLDYTNMAGHIPPPASFVEWINAIIAIKADWDYSDYAYSWLTGARQLVASGVTTVADTEAVPELLPEVWKATPLRVQSFIELLAVRGRHSPAVQVRQALERLAGTAWEPARLAGGLSPHALYSTTEELLRLAAKQQLPLSIHVAESDAEDDMFRHATGPMHSWLERNGRDMSDCGNTSPVRRLAALGLLSEKLLAIHCNYLDEEDIRLLAEHSVHVVHCPRSHEFFDHAPFKFAELTAAGLNLSLATDSLASVHAGGTPKPTLDLFEEMRLAMDRLPGLSPKTAVEMVTANPARALARQTELGCIAPGAHADLITVPGSKIEDIPATKAPTAIMIDGRWIKA